VTVTNAEKLYLGVDIGGTKVAAGLVDPSGNIVFKTRVPMDAHTSQDAAMAAVSAAIDQVLAHHSAFPSHTGAPIAGIGVSAPGPLDPFTGIVLNPPNLPCWRDYPLRDQVERLYKLPVMVNNDANAAGLAEALWGAGRGYNNVFYATIGTGIGTAIVFNRRIYLGRTGAAAEGGHVSIDYNGPVCTCGKRGCIEILASGNAIGARARAAVAADEKLGATLLKLANGDINKVNGELVGHAYQHGDPLAKEVLRQTAELLGIWLGNTVDLLEPQVIVIGGGVSSLLQQWFPTIAETLVAWSINQRAGEIPLLLANYKADSGIAGAAALCVQGPILA
jgi:glucokinase